MALSILFACDFYPPFLGGAELQYQLVAQGLARRGHRIAVATTWREGLPEEETDAAGVRIYRLKGLTTRIPFFFHDPAHRRTPPPAPDPALTLALRRIIAREQPDVVDAYCWIAYSCAAALAGRRTPLVLAARDFGFSCLTRNLMYRHTPELCSGPGLGKCVSCAACAMPWLKAAVGATALRLFRPLVVGHTWAMMTNSSYNAEISRRDWLDHLPRAARQRIQTPQVPCLLNDADAAWAESIAEEPPIARQLPAGPFILFVGALSRHKGLFTLLDAYRRLASPPPLVLIGTLWGDTPREMPPGVTVIHDAPHREVMWAWRRCLFGVAPSECPETFGLSVVEVMSVGRPVIASAIGGPAETVLDGQTGLLVPPGDAEALAAAMQRLIAGDAWREQLGRQARAHIAAHYDYEETLSQYESFYRAVALRSVGAR